MADDSPILHHFMLVGPAPAAAQQPAAEQAQPPEPPQDGGEGQGGAAPPPPPQQQPDAAQPGGFDDGFVEHLLEGDLDGVLFGDAEHPHYQRLTVGGAERAAGRGAYADRSLVVQGSAEFGELYIKGHLVTSGGYWSLGLLERCRARVWWRCATLCSSPCCRPVTACRLPATMPPPPDGRRARQGAHSSL